MVLDLVAKGHAGALVSLSALLGAAMGPREGQPAGGLVALVVQSHGDATSVLLAWQPRDHHRGDVLVPSVGDHWARGIHRDHQRLTHGSILLDQGYIRLVQLQGGTVRALACLGRHHDSNDHVSMGGLGVATVGAVRACKGARAGLQASDALLDIDLVNIVARGAVPAAAAADRQRVAGAGLLADQGHLVCLAQWQHATLVLQHHGGLDDDLVSECELAGRLDIVRAKVSALVVGQRLKRGHCLARDLSDRHRHGRSRGGHGCAAERVVLVDAAGPVRRRSRCAALSPLHRIPTLAPRALAKALGLGSREPLGLTIAADVAPRLRPPAAEAAIGVGRAFQGANRCRGLARIDG
mmetsp:Transcript_18998/g.48713  ORF Transcript_18998/g.48713 Transcript_18998/m.48713 type:complete len:353 (+) Transcript_18998:1284-2342(+)